jgi:hypothetical protein
MPRWLAIAALSLIATPALADEQDGAGFPPPVEPGPRADGSVVTAVGPQILISSAGDIRLLDMAADMRHKPSGFTCPSTIEGVPVTLMTVDPRPDYLSCDYRAGTELRYRPDDPIRYHVILAKAKPGVTPRALFEEMAADGRAALRITGDHAPPLPAGAAPGPQFAVFWDTEDAGVQGLWAGKAGGWIVLMRAQYPPGSANDAEAARVAQILFTQIAQQVR